MPAQDQRSVARVVRPFRPSRTRVFWPFPNAYLSDFDPFLLLDEMGPMEPGPGGGKGAFNRPHRGFETMTYMIDGRIGRRERGDVHWMTAGAGVIHFEMPEVEFVWRGGARLHGFQLRMNLPRRENW
jgi:quercetin 2,3-dioxygenase